MAKGFAMTPFQLSLIALAFITALCFYVYIKDRVEKEPPLLLVSLFAAGAVIFPPVYYLQKLVTGLFDSAFASRLEVSVSGIREFSSLGAQLGHSALCAFIGIALIGESAKWLILYFAAKSNRHFNCLFDGVVYSTFLSMGFAFCEALRYALADGWDTFLSRLIAALSAHLFFGVLMGYFFTAWKTRAAACRIEAQMLANGIIARKRGKKSINILFIGLVGSIIIRGAFIFNSYIDSSISNTIFTVFSIVLYIAGFIGVRFLSSVDGSIDNKAKGIAEKWHGISNE